MYKVCGLDDPYNRNITFEKEYEDWTDAQDKAVQLLEDDVERLSEENYEYAREIYTLEKTINSLSDELRLRFEGQKSSKENYQKGEETPRMVH